MPAVLMPRWKLDGGVRDMHCSTARGSKWRGRRLGCGRHACWARTALKLKRQAGSGEMTPIIRVGDRLSFFAPHRTCSCPYKSINTALAGEDGRSRLASAATSEKSDSSGLLGRIGGSATTVEGRDGVK